VTATPDAAATERFRALIARRLGLQFDGGKRDFLADILRRELAARGLDAACYLERLADAGNAAKEWRALAQALTVTETYFFRNAAQFAALREAVATEWPGRSVAILSAGCASGEEPYSIAMILADRAPSIRAIDINAAMLAKAAAGRYSAWSLRETAADLRARHFAPEGNEFALDPRVCGAVAFEERNLVEEDAAFWRPGTFEIVFCRNVLMYFAPAVARAVIARIARSLAPGGLLFLGHAETLRGLSRDFDLRHTHGTFYYRRKDELEAPDAVAEIADPVWQNVPPAADGAVDRGAAWHEVIEAASERVRGIAARSPGAAAPLAAMTPSPAQEVAHVMALLADEHYAEASTLLDSLSAEYAREPEIMFLRSVLLMHRGDLAGAERVCSALLLRDGRSAGAHYLMALCREADGDCRGAAEHDGRAAALDPYFAMPRLHLGLLARRTGDQALARRELARAFALLPGEQAARLLLFGGGFGREALRALCQAELASAGGV
jgi:chemotaxis protein methyltransferase CheR